MGNLDPMPNLRQQFSVSHVCHKSGLNIFNLKPDMFSKINLVFSTSGEHTISAPYLFDFSAKFVKFSKVILPILRKYADVK